MVVTIFSKPNCPYCTMAKQLAESKGAEKINYLTMGEDYTAEYFMSEFPTARTFPQIILNGEKIGGYSALVEMLSNEE